MIQLITIPVVALVAGPVAAPVVVGSSWSGPRSLLSCRCRCCSCLAGQITKYNTVSLPDELHNA